MNYKQKIVLIVVAGAILLTLLFPPFQIKGTNRGYGFILSPPFRYAMVNSGTLLVQWVGIILLGAIAFFLVKNDETSQQENQIAKIKTSNTKPPPIPPKIIKERSEVDDDIPI